MWLRNSGFSILFHFSLFSQNNVIYLYPIKKTTMDFNKEFIIKKLIPVKDYFSLIDKDLCIFNKKYFDNSEKLLKNYCKEYRIALSEVVMDDNRVFTLSRLNSLIFNTMRTSLPRFHHHAPIVIYVRMNVKAGRFFAGGKKTKMTMSNRKERGDALFQQEGYKNNFQISLLSQKINLCLYPKLMKINNLLTIIYYETYHFAFVYRGRVYHAVRTNARMGKS